MDPLTELARLIGQSDPFGTDPRRPNPRPADSRAEPPSYPAYDDRAQDPQDGPQDDPQYDAQDAHHDARYRPHDDTDDRGYPPDDGQQASADQEQGYADDNDGRPYPDQPYYADHDEAGGEPGYGHAAGPVPYGAPYGDAQGGNPDDLSDYYDDAPPPRRRGWLVTAAAFVGLALVGSAGAFAYRAVFTGGAPSIIARDPGPNKIVSASQSADSRTNKQVDRIAGGSQDERMVSHEEQPIILPDTQSTPPAASMSPAAGPGATATAPALAPPAGPADVAAPGLPGGAAPRKIHTVVIKPDASAANAAAVPAPAAPRPAAPRVTAAQAPAQSAPVQLAPPHSAASTPPAAPHSKGPLSLSPQAVASASPEPVRAAPRAAAGAEQAGSGYYVQVTAQKTEAEAQSSFRGIQAKYASLLGSHRPVIRRKNLGGKGVFYGAQVGPFSRDAAVQLCNSLKSAGGPCMIQRN